MSIFGSTEAIAIDFWQLFLGSFFWQVERKEERSGYSCMQLREKNNYRAVRGGEKERERNKEKLREEEREREYLRKLCFSLSWGQREAP